MKIIKNISTTVVFYFVAAVLWVLEKLLLGDLSSLYDDENGDV